MLSHSRKYAQILSSHYYRPSLHITHHRHNSSNSHLPTEADVIIIGGGAIGTSALYHLALEGVNAILLEKDQITAGTTWHSAGLLWRLRPNDTEIQLINRTRELVKSNGILEEETGMTCGWNSNGGLFIASSKERMDEYKRLHTIGKYFDIESHVLSPSESKDLYPLMNINDVYGTLYSPGDGTVEPAEFVSTLARAAKKRGGKIFENVKVDTIDSEVTASGHKSVRGVITSHGERIKANKVIICGGVWSRDFGLQNNINIPLCAMKHAYVLSDTIPGIRTMPCIRDHDLSIYLRVQGECLQIGGYESNPIFWDKVDESFAFSLFNLDYDAFSVHLENGMKRVPIIAETGIKTEVCGPESFTADHKPLLGTLREYSDNSLLVCAGFNSAGIMLSGGCGEQIAQWCVNGYPSLDVFGYDINRFHPSLTANNEWIKQRSHESYAKNYSIVFPMDEPLASRNMRRSVIHDELVKNGCFFQERQGYERPGWFSGATSELLDYDYYGEYGYAQHSDYKYRDLVDSEYTFSFATNHEVIGDEVRACRNDVVIFDQSYFGKFYLRGVDAVAAMQYICTANADIDVNKSVYTAMCNDSGRVECDLAIHRIAHDAYYITAGGLTYSRDFHHISSQILKAGFDCQLSDDSDDISMLSVQGPKSRDLLYSLMTETDRNNAILSNDFFPFSSNKEIELMDLNGNCHKMMAIRLTFVGEMGFELHMNILSAQSVYLAILEFGKKFAIKNSGYRAIDSLSIEKGYLHWHQDIGLNDTPFEAGIGFVVNKGKLNDENIEFVGKNALMKQKENGVKKRLVHVSLDESNIRLHGLETIWRKRKDSELEDSICVGYLRSAAHDFSENKSIGTGYLIHHDKKGGIVNAKYIKQHDVEYEIEVMGQRYPCHIAMKSDFDPKNKRIHGDYQDIEKIL